MHSQIFGVAFDATMKCLPRLLLTAACLSVSKGQSVRRLRHVFEIQQETKASPIDSDLVLEKEAGDFFFRYLQASIMSMPDDECVSDFKTLQSLVISSKGATTTVPIVLCAGVVKFDSLIDMTDAKFEMTCAESSTGGACVLDGQGKGPLFEAGRLGRQLSDHTALFENIVFINGNNTIEIEGAQHQGGALLFVGGDTTLNGCTFRDNTASDGGALYVERGKALIDNCLFEVNVSNDVGGTMKVEQPNDDISLGVLDMVIRDTKFRNNTALGGGVNGKDIFNDYYPNGSVDCGAGSGNQFCDAAPGSPTALGVLGDKVDDLCPGADIDC